MREQERERILTKVTQIRAELLERLFWAIERENVAEARSLFAVLDGTFDNDPEPAARPRWLEHRLTDIGRALVYEAWSNFGAAIEAGDLKLAEEHWWDILTALMHEKESVH